jgi:hypothetical protein
MRNITVLAVIAVISCAAGSACAAIIYSTGSNGTTLITVDSTNGATTTIGPTGHTGTHTAAFSPGGILFGATEYPSSTNRFGSYNLSSGVFTATGLAGWGVGETQMLAMEVSAGGTVYGGGRTTGGFFTINPATGQATLVGTHAIVNVGDFAFSTGGTLYAVNNADQLYTINPATGASTLVAAISGLANADAIGSLAFDGSKLIAISYNLTATETRMYSVNPATAAATFIAFVNQSGVWGGDVIPEPTALASVCMFAVSALALRRRRG